MAKVMVLKSVKADMTSHGGFVWPRSGEVVAPDWDPEPHCRNGFHGWLRAVGDFSLKVTTHDAVWMALEVEEESCIDLDGKVKFQKCTVIYAGRFDVAFRMCHASAVGNYGHASAVGDYGHASAAGYSGHASAVGNSGHASAAGNSGHASAVGNYGHASAVGNYGHASAVGYYGHASAAGDYGHASAAGRHGHASAAGNSGHASAAGYSGHASAVGRYGSAVVLGLSGQAMAGQSGSVILTYLDSENRRRHAVGYVGENEIEAGVWYQCDESGNLVAVSEEE